MVKNEGARNVLREMDAKGVLVRVHDVMYFFMDDLASLGVSQKRHRTETSVSRKYLGTA